MVARVVGAVAEHESEHKSERLRSKHEEIARDGRWVGGHPPFGYLNAGGGRLEIDPSAADSLREAAQRVLRGESLRAVCEDFQARGEPTAQGGAWRPAQLALSLTRPAVMGIRELHGSQVKANCWPAIFDPPTIDRLVRAIEYPGSRIRRVRVALLGSGLLRCGRCGWQLYSSGTGSAPRLYVCNSRFGGCGSLSIRAERADKILTDAVIDRLTGDDRRRLVPTRRSRDRYAARLVDCRSKLAEIAARYARGELEDIEWHDTRSALVHEECTLHGRAGLAEYHHVLAGQPRGRQRLTSDWASYPLHRRSEIIAAVIDHVTIRPSSRGAGRFDPRRVTDGIRWVDADWPQPARTGT